MVMLIKLISLCRTMLLRCKGGILETSSMTGTSSEFVYRVQMTVEREEAVKSKPLPESLHTSFILKK